MQKLKSGVPIVRALERGLALLQLFSQARPQQSLTELAREADLDVGTTRRLLQTLMVTGFVDFNETAAKYRLTSRIRDLASAVEDFSDLRDIGRDYLDEISNRTHATAFLWTYADGHAVCIDRVRAAIPDVDATWFTVGARTPMNCGGGPRVLFAFLDKEDRAKALDQPFVARTPKSIVVKSELIAEADRIKKKGWDLAVDDFVIGLAGLGVPIFSKSGRLIGAISVSTLTTAFGNPKSPTHLTALQAVADSITKRMTD
jgi:DNA-binding IclR family transcriptional regulator